VFYINEFLLRTVLYKTFTNLLDESGGSICYTPKRKREENIWNNWNANYKTWFWIWIPVIHCDKILDLDPNYQLGTDRYCTVPVTHSHFGTVPITPSYFSFTNLYFCRPRCCWRRIKPTPIRNGMKCWGSPSNWLDQSGQYLFVESGSVGGVSSQPIFEKEWDAGACHQTGSTSQVNVYL